MYSTTYDRSHLNLTPARPGGSAVARFVRRRPLTAFLVWFFIPSVTSPRREGAR
jgi:hypothetical protein